MTVQYERNNLTRFWHSKFSKTWWSYSVFLLPFKWTLFQIQLCFLFSDTPRYGYILQRGVVLETPFRLDKLSTWRYDRALQTVPPSNMSENLILLEIGYDCKLTWRNVMYTCIALRSSWVRTTQCVLDVHYIKELEGVDWVYCSSLHMCYSTKVH